jgi:hypothetical protein
MRLYLVFVQYFFCTCHLAQLVSCFTHWRVTELGRIEYNAESSFTLIRPYDMASFVRQVERLKRLNTLKDLIQTKDNDTKRESRKSKQNLQHWWSIIFFKTNHFILDAQTVSGFQDAFYATDPDCQRAETPLAKLSFYESYYITWSAHGFFMPKESLEVPRSEVKFYKKPFCDVALLPFSMGNFEHLEVF